jgi:death on curing protein
MGCRTSRRSAAATWRVIEYLELEDVLELADLLFGSRPLRDMGLRGSAVERPRTSAFGSDAYPDLWTKAAALLHSIVNNHALVDGNRRLGWMATATFLIINEVDLFAPTNDQIYDLAIGVATQPLEIDDIAAQLRRLCNP